MRTGKGPFLNRFTAKLVHGFARLAFWRKPAAVTLEEAEPSATPETATARKSKRIEAESSVGAEVPALQTGWFVRLKQVLRWRRHPAQEAVADADPAVAMERSSPKRSDAGATADDSPMPQPSWLARLKGIFRRRPKPEPLEAEDDTSPSRSKPPRTATASSQAEPAADEELVPASLVQRVRAVLSNKWVWIPGISVMLVAIIATMMWMLLQSGQEKKQLQIELVAAQKKLKQASISKQPGVKPAAVNPGAPRPAGNPAVATASGTSSGPKGDGGAGGCDVSNKENVTQNLKNCIDSFNAMAN
jgi:hypothetical protein